MSALQEQFVTEARELVRQATDDLIALERDGTSPERIDSVFRAFHTLKGSAGVVELPAMSVMLHAAEDLLAGVRGGTLRADAEIIDAALACLDQVSRWVDDFEAAGSLPARGRRRRPCDGRTVAIVAAGVRKTGSRGRPCQISVASGGEDALPEWVIAADRVRSRCDGVAIAGAAMGGDGYFLRADRRLFLQWRRSVATDAADSRPVGISTSNRVRPSCLSRISIPMPAICACGPFRPAIATKSPVSFGWCRIRYISSAFRRRRFLPRGARCGSDNQTLIRKVIEAQCELLRVANRRDDFAGCVGAAARVANERIASRPASAVGGYRGARRCSLRWRNTTPAPC